MSKITLPEIKPLITAQLDAIEGPVDTLLSARRTLLNELRQRPGLKSIINACIGKVPGTVQATKEVLSMMKAESVSYNHAKSGPRGPVSSILQSVDETDTGWRLTMPKAHIDATDSTQRTTALRKLLAGEDLTQWTLELGEFDGQKKWTLLKRGLEAGGRAKVFYDNAQPLSYQALQGGVWYLGKSRKINPQRSLPEDDHGSARLVDERDWAITGPLYSYGIRYNTLTGEISIVRGLNAEGFDF